MLEILSGRAKKISQENSFFPYGLLQGFAISTGLKEEMVWALLFPETQQNEKCLPHEELLGRGTGKSCGCLDQ
jgi:hypothetical protein